MAGLLTYEKEKSVHRIVLLRMDEIQVNLQKIQEKMDPDVLQALAQDIVSNGMQQPLHVRCTETGYELISGTNGFHAAQIAGLQTVPCVVIEMDSRNAAIQELVNYIRRSHMSFFEEASAIEKLISYYGMTQEDAASLLGKAQSTIANKLRLLRLTEEEREIILQYHLTERHARALLRLSAPQERMHVLHQVIKQGFNVEKTEFAVEQVIGSYRRREPYRKRNRTIQSVRAFLNTINKAVETMQNTGIRIDMQRIQHKEEMELCIRVPYLPSGDKKAAEHFVTYHET